MLMLTLGEGNLREFCGKKKTKKQKQCITAAKRASVYFLVLYIFPVNNAFVSAQTGVMYSPLYVGVEIIKANNHTFCAGHLAALIIHGAHSRVTVHLSCCPGDVCVCCPSLV